MLAYSHYFLFFLTLTEGYGRARSGYLQQPNEMLDLASILGQPLQVLLLMTLLRSVTLLVLSFFFNSEEVQDG